MHDDKEIHEKAKEMFKHRKIALTCLYSNFIFLLMGRVSIFFIVIGVLLLVTFLVLTYVYWKCPACKMRFPSRHSGNESNIIHCPYCGVKLRHIRSWRDYE